MIEALNFFASLAVMVTGAYALGWLVIPALVALVQRRMRKGGGE